MDRLDLLSAARLAARVLILDDQQRLLLLEARDRDNGQRWWVAPGGGLDGAESFEDAARREVAEEVGLVVELGPWVWYRRHRFTFEGHDYDQYERFFVARSFSIGTRPSRPDSYVVGPRWWTLDELASAAEDFTPRRLSTSITDIAAGRYPALPIDCGV